MVRLEWNSLPPAWQPDAQTTEPQVRLPNKVYTFSGFLFLSPKNRAFFIFVSVNLATLWLNFVINNRTVRWKTSNSALLSFSYVQRPWFISLILKLIFKHQRVKCDWVRPEIPPLRLVCKAPKLNFTYGKRRWIKCLLLTEIAVELRGSDVSYAGQVKVRYQGVWGTLCGIDWKTETATVICRQLGFKGVELDFLVHNRYKYGATIIYDANPGPVWFNGGGCSGHERTLGECQLWQEKHCGLSDEVAIICQEEDISINGKSLKSASLSETRLIWIAPNAPNPKRYLCYEIHLCILSKHMVLPLPKC